MKEWLEAWEERVDNIEDLGLIEDFFLSLYIVESFKFDRTIPLVDQHMNRISHIIGYFTEKDRDIMGEDQ